MDSLGRLWFTDRLTHAIGMLDPETRRFTRIETPTPESAPYGITRAPDGTLWFGESNGGNLGRIDPATGALTEIPIPGLDAGPQLVVWARGAVWFTSKRDAAYGSYTPATARTWVVEDVVREPYGIAAVGDEVWIGSQRDRWLHRAAPANDVARRIPLKAPARRMAGGDDGRVWLTQHGAGRVAGVDVESEQVTLIEVLAQPARPYGIDVDDEGRVWYAERGNNRVVIYDPRTGDRTSIPLPAPAATVRHIVVDTRRGRAWLPLSDGGLIAVVEF